MVGPYPPIYLTVCELLFIMLYALATDFWPGLKILYVHLDSLLLSELWRSKIHYKKRLVMYYNKSLNPGFYPLKF